jgi:hypothetical protein
MSDSAKLDKILEALASVGKRCTARALPSRVALSSQPTSSLDTLESKVVVGGASSAAAAASGGSSSSGDVAPFVDGARSVRVQPNETSL